MLEHTATGRLRREDTLPHAAAPDDVPLLVPTHDGPARAAAARLAGRHPAVVWLTTLLGGLAVLLVAAIGLGLLLVHVILPAGAQGPDEHVETWLAAHRSGALDDAAYVGSMIGDVPILPGLVLLVAIVAVATHRARVAAFAIGCGLVELATYRVASLVVHRDRPEVPRLDHLPGNQSYPSGHTAASVAVYVGIALVISSRWPAARRLWPLALLLPVIVGLSRMERGMHHPLDVLSGALIGAGAILVALVATRAAVAAAPAREETR